MVPLALTVCRFGSFIKEQTFKFPARPGLYFMRGVNETEPRLEANGAGKTTLWAALCWLFYGKTPRGLKAGDAANWEEGKGCSVELCCLLNGSETSLCWIKRTWSPNSWTIRYEMDPNDETYDLTADKTNPVLEALRLEFTAFLNTVLMAQARPMFLDLPAPEKAALFSEVMGLDKWLDSSKKASKKATEQDMELRELEREQSRLKGQLQTLNESDVSVDFDAWEKKRKERLDAVGREYEKRLENEERIKDALKEAEEEQERCRVGLKDAIAENERWETLLRDQLKIETEADKELARVDEQVKQLQEAAKILAGDTCPVCEQPISKHTHDKHEGVVKRTKERAKELYAKLQEERRRTNNTKKKLEDVCAVLSKITDTFEDAQRKARDTRRALESEQRKLDELEDDAQRIEEEENPYAAMRKQNSSNVRELRLKLRELEDRIEQAEHRYSVLKFWVQGFKEIRLQEISDGVGQLEVEANNEISALGLQDWALRFDVDRETKSGSLQRGFSVRVESPHNTRSVPWEAWSGGESQRLRIGAQMGLSNLIRGHSGTALELEVWDEPSNWLSAQGVQDLLDALARRAQQEKRQIWVVDHRSLAYGGWSGTVTIVKTPEGSIIREG